MFKVQGSKFKIFGLYLPNERGYYFAYLLLFPSLFTLYFSLPAFLSPPLGELEGAFQFTGLIVITRS